MFRTVKLTEEQWSFICSGLRDCADQNDKLAAKETDEENRQTCEEVAKENRIIAHQIELQVFGEYKRG